MCEFLSVRQFAQSSATRHLQTSQKTRKKLVHVLRSMILALSFFPAQVTWMEKRKYINLSINLTFQSNYQHISIWPSSRTAKREKQQLQL